MRFALLLLVAGHFMQALAFGSLMLLPLYIDALGADRTQIGLIMGTASAGGLALRPIVGWALDTLGRKPTLITGTVFVAAAMGGLGLVHDTGPLIYADRLLFGIADGALFTGYFAYAADLVPVSRRTEGIALFGISGLAPLALNPLIGELGVRAIDLRWAFPVVGLVVLASLLPLAALPEPRRPRSTEPFRFRAVMRAIHQPPLRPVWLATIIFSGMVATFAAFVTVAAEHRGVERPAAVWLTYAGGAAFIRLFGARLPDRLGSSNFVAPALGAYGAAFLVAAGAESGAGFLIAGLLAGIGHGYCFPVLTSQVVSRVSDRLRGSALATFTALWELAALGLSPLCGALADGFGDSAMFAAISLAGAGGLLAWVALEHRHGLRGPKPEAPTSS